MNRMALVGVGVVVVGISALAWQPRPAEAASKGWRVRLCPEGSTVTAVSLSAGPAGDRYAPDRKQWAVLAMESSGKPAEAVPPAPIARAPSIWIGAVASPVGAHANLCVFYGERPVREVIFDGSMELEFTINGSGDCPC